MICARKTHKGKLIAVERLYSLGKSTQISLAKRWLELTGVKLFVAELNYPAVVIKTVPEVKNQKLITYYIAVFVRAINIDLQAIVLIVV